MKTTKRKSRRAPAAVLVALLAACVLVALAIVSGCAKQESKVGTYYCPMHPSYVSDRPGDCPICNMRLVRREAPESTAVTPQPPPAGAPAMPGAHESMSMPEVEGEPVGSSGAAGTGATQIPGMAAVRLDARGRELAGIQTAVATRDSLTRSVRTVGTIVPDETRVRHINTRIDGYVEKLFVAANGQFVRQGEPILSIDSPELLASQEEFLRAREAAARLATSSIPEVKQGADDLVRAARRRLEFYEVPESFIAALEQRGTAARQVTMVAQVSGYVTSKSVSEGQHVTPGAELYTVTDLSRVWVEADFYENEARLVRVGQMATLSLPYASDRAFTGRVAYVYPYLDPMTRTLKVRLEFPNPDLQLKPAMYVDVTLAVESAPVVMIPANAVLDSGTRQLVFVETAPNHFEPRSVEVGRRAADQVEILSGVQEGERVVVRANFLLDSESRLRGALPGMPAGHEHGGKPR